MGETKHAPLPWELSSANPNQELVPEVELCAMVDGRALTIATINTRLADWEPNARLLRDACNSHAELLEALRRIAIIAGAGVGAAHFQLIKELADAGVAKTETQ